MMRSRYAVAYGAGFEGLPLLLASSYVEGRLMVLRLGIIALDVLANKEPRRIFIGGYSEPF